MAEEIDGSFVIARVGVHLFGVDIDSVDEVLPGPGEADPDAEVEALFGIDRDAGGERMRLCMSQGRVRAELAVPRPALEIGRRLRGRCHSPPLVAAALERCCLMGVVLDYRPSDASTSGAVGGSAPEFISLLDVGRFWSRLPSASKGEST